MERLLITGFEKFGDINENPSQHLVEWLREQKLSADYEIRFEILPVEFEKAFLKVEPILRSFEPRRVLMFGVAANREKPELECYAHNLMEQKGWPAREILHEGPDALPTTYDWKGTFERLSQNFQIGLSQSAGSYVCNDLYFRVLLATRYSLARALFVHVPNWPREHPRFSELCRLALDMIKA
jgi:pyroglutamyl-peptidase